MKTEITIKPINVMNERDGKLGAVWLVINWASLLQNIDLIKVLGAISSIILIIYYGMRCYQQYFVIKETKRSQRFFEKIENRLEENQKEKKKRKKKDKE